MSIEVVSDVEQELVDAFARLMPQYSPGARLPTARQLAEVAQAPGVGNTTSVSVPTMNPTASRAMSSTTPGATLGYIEDVVVDERARGQGVGEALVKQALQISAERGASQTDLLSGNHRPAAIRLYQRVGFQRFETNVWRYLHDQATEG